MPRVDDEAPHASSHSHGPNASSRWRLVACGFLAVAAFLLFTEHRAHLLGPLPYLVLLLCPLMHLFMHGGHGEHGAEGERARREP